MFYNIVHKQVLKRYMYYKIEGGCKIAVLVKSNFFFLISIYFWLKETLLAEIKLTDTT